jgi:iron complex transport system substrate-binding protein
MTLGRRAFLTALALSGCKKTSAGGASTAKRIVSLSPSTTETLFAIGAGDRVVGRSRYCDWPEEAKKLPQVGGYIDPSFEAILALRPDFVTGARGPAGDAITKRLEARGIATYFPPTESFSAIEEMIERLGSVTSHEEGAQRVNAGIRARVAEVRDKHGIAPANERPRVLLVFGLDPLSVAGSGSFADQMVRLAGGMNVVVDGGAYPTIGVEHVLTLDPDVILNAAIAESHGKERIGADTPGWSRVRAVREGRVRAITDESVLRPGPRIGDGLAVVAHAIHS